MGKSVLLSSFLLTLCLLLGFVAGVYWSADQSVVKSDHTCAPNDLPGGYWRLDSSLREFDDIRELAVNVPRLEIGNWVREMQTIRRNVEELAVPDCLASIKQLQAAYMDQVIDILLGFVGGAESSLVQKGLEDSSISRTLLEEAIVGLRGVTLTPSPTPYQVGLVIPVTGASPTLAASETPVLIRALITHGEGVNLRQGPGVNYPFFTILGPDSEVLALGISTDGQWVLVQTLTAEPEIGWVFLPLVALPIDVQELPVAIQP